VLDKGLSFLKYPNILSEVKILFIYYCITKYVTMCSLYPKIGGVFVFRLSQNYMKVIKIKSINI
jgi:hypothetical protein